MKKKRVLNLRQPHLFKPSTVRRTAKPGATFNRDIKLSSLSNTNIESTSSFRYDNPGSGLKSTQEVSVDYSRFEKHTFFNSAVSKVNIAFDRIINEFPFDGAEREIEGFIDSLTGYEKHIFDTFPKNTGYLIFSGTVSGEDYHEGTYLKVNDKAGTSYPEFSKNRTGNSVINPGLSTFSIEMQIFPPDIVNDNQVICQMLSGTNGSFGDGGFTLGLSSSTSTSESTLIFAVASGTTHLHATGTINKGQWNHICATFNRSPGAGNLLLYASGNLIASSSDSADEMGTLSFNSLMPLYIGSGSAQDLSLGMENPAHSAQTLWTPRQTFSGSIDEFRFFHKTRSIIDQKETALSEIYPDDEGSLRLYFRFNEPSGSYSIPDVALDSSGNSLHTNITNFDSTNSRLTGSNTDWGVCMTAENKSLSPILFPSFKNVRGLNADLLLSASLFDGQNPNLITRLIPPHYLEMGSEDQGFNSITGSMGDMIKPNSIPGSSVIGSPQIMTAFLLIWAKYFDEIKIFIDHFSNLVHIDYDDIDTAADKFLPFVAKYYGFELPGIFSNTSPEQFIKGRNIDGSYSISAESLRFVQNQIWKRILINISDIRASKGTKHSVESVFRAAGIDPDSFFTIREYGGPTKRSLVGLRQSRKEVSTALSFTGSLAPWPEATLATTSSDGLNSLMPILRSPFLSGSRVEVGYPLARGGFNNAKYVAGEIVTHGTSTDRSDGLFTSGCFTYEGTYIFPRLVTGSYPVSQSLVRFQVTGSASPSDRNGVVANLIAVSGANNSLTGSGSDLKLFVRPSYASTSEKTLEIALTGANIFNGEQWNISFGRIRSDSPQLDLDSENAVSSSYFLRCGHQSAGEITSVYQTSSFFMEVSNRGVTTNKNVFSSKVTTYNASGVFFVVGSQSLGDPTGNYFLNDESVAADSAARVTDFAGRISRIRFWSKALESGEWKEHVRNFKSLGVKDPLVNFNFNTLSSGSFERLRIDATTDQRVTASNSQGEIEIFDFSKNSTINSEGSAAPWIAADQAGSVTYYHLSGTGFEADKSVIRPEEFYYSFLSPRFDIGQTDDKVRIRSFKDADKIKNSNYAGSAPVYEVPPSEQPDDDTRFSIDYSAVKALDEDIMNIFSSLEFFDDALGQPNMMFDEYYPDIDQVRKIYFNRLIDKINVKKFFEIFKWFDTSFTAFIEQLIPRKTKFLGINYVIESHVLERHRHRYLFDEIYQPAGERERTFDVATLIDIDVTIDGHGGDL